MQMEVSYMRPVRQVFLEVAWFCVDYELVSVQAQKWLLEYNRLGNNAWLSGDPAKEEYPHLSILEGQQASNVARMPVG